MKKVSKMYRHSYDINDIRFSLNEGLKGLISFYSYLCTKEYNLFAILISEHNVSLDYKSSYIRAYHTT